MKKDINNRQDIKLIVKEFYDKLLNDSTLKHFFEHIIRQNALDHHLDIVTDFWNNILFNSSDYQRNAMLPHLNLNKRLPFKNDHFKSWLSHLYSTIDTKFEGEKSEMMKTRALSIATIMEIKMMNS